MSLAASSKLGPYEILAPLGAGGMGEVYKARDTRLNRIVAIKTSKAQFSERFAREARAIAALNDPHICQLYDVGPDYLVMEYVEGSPLKGPLSEDKAIEYAGQILSALDAAHRKGITHRDLKPANIMVNKQHGIKLLDFGLARIATESADSTVTVPGEKMGTPAYMSPEQWEGKPGDARSDIYAFGCVLYEMLTGKRASQDRGPVEPAALDSIVRTCMEQQPENRWQSAGDIRRAMTLPAPPAPKPSRAWQWVAVAALVLIAGAFLLGSWLNRMPAAGEVVSFQIYPPEKTTFSSPVNSITLNVPQFALSPDGRTIVFAAGAEGDRSVLWQRRLSDVAAQALTGTEDAQDPFWSADSRWIGFFSESKLKKVPANGGRVQVVVPAVTDIRGGAWAPDDTILYASSTQPIQRVAAAGGASAAVTALAAVAASHRYPDFLPDGRHFLYVDPSASNLAGLYAGSLDGRSRKFVARTKASAVYSVPGYLLFVDGNSLFGQAFDTNRLAASGEPFLVAEHVGRSSAFKSAVSASRAGTLAYAGTLLENDRLTWLDRAGRTLDSTGPDGYYTDFRLSPNDRSLAASLLDLKTGVIDIWMTDLARKRTSKFVSGGLSLSASPLWSPDGAQVAFRTNRVSGVTEFFRRSGAGGGGEQQILSLQTSSAAGIGTGSLICTDWSPDGQSMLFSVPGPGSGTDLWIVPLVGNQKPVKYLATPAEEMHGNFSPDGHLVAYTSNESGRFEVYVQTLPLSEKKWPVSTRGGYEPRWRADGREIYYLSEDRKLMAVPVEAGPSFGVPKALFQTRVPAGVTANRTHYVPSRDGQRFLVNTQIGDPSPTPITVVLNWTAGLKR